MSIKPSAKKNIIRISYIRLALVSIVTLLAMSACGLIDSIVISRHLDTRAVAAVGYYAPMNVLTDLIYVVGVGACLLCGNFIGSGQQSRVNSLFTTTFTVTFAYGALLSTLLTAARVPISALLGARGENGQLLSQYMAGYAPGIVFTQLSALLMSLASFNGAIHRSYVAIGALFCLNSLLDLLLVGPLGLFGVGLATTISCLASFLIMLPAYLGRNQTVHFEWGSFDAKLLMESIRRGLPSLLFTAGLLIKNSLINYSLTVYVGYEGVAVANVLGSLCGIAGSFSGGFANAFSSLMSLYVGEEDRESVIDVFHVALRIGLAFMSLMVITVMALSAPLTDVFFARGTRVWQMGRNMFLLGFLFFPVNVFINLLMNGYKAQGRMTLCNILSFLEAAMIGVFALVTAPRFGDRGVWLANTWSDLLAMAILLLSVFLFKKKVTFHSADLLKLPADFGAKPDEFAEYVVRSMAEAVTVSKAVTDFCRRRGLSKRTAFLAGLCVEEIAKNVYQHGAVGKRSCNVNVRVTCRDQLIIRIQDDCRQFDPRARMNLYTPAKPESNIGLRLVAKMTSDIDYYNNAGINTMIMKIRPES